jgi:uncharacterized RDD family membrane protein YckC
VQDSASSSYGPEVSYTGFWWRFLANLVDTLIMSAVQFGLLFLLFPGAVDMEVAAQGEPGTGIGPLGELETGSGALVTGVNLLAILLGVAYVLGFWLTKQATPGKLAIGARIVDARTGGKPSVGQFILRYLGYFLSSLPLFLGFLWVAFDRRKQGWHDKIAGTVVVRGRGTEPVRFEEAAPRAAP